MTYGRTLYISLLTVMTISLLICSYGCSGERKPVLADTHSQAGSTVQHENSQSMHDAHAAESAVVVRKVKQEEIGRKAVCPVQGKSFTVKQDTDAAEYRGKTYFFCCPGCAPKFRENPNRYVSK